MTSNRSGGSVQLSVIIPVYNTEPYLRRCLDTVLHQGIDASDYEILVVDDGSTDTSLAIAQEYAARHPNVHVRTQQNQGAAVARNSMFEVARGRYVMFVDSDDYLAPNVLAPLLRTACANGLDVLAFDFQRVSPDEPEPAPPRVEDLAATPTVITGPQYVATFKFAGESVCYLFEREFLLRTGARFDVGRIAEDVVFTATLVSSAQRLAHLPVSVYRYVQRAGSIMNTTDDVHTRKLVDDYAHLVHRLDDLRRRNLAAGPVPDGFERRSRCREQTFVFFLIARVVRSGLPARPTLEPVLDQFRAIGMYPMDAFPGEHFPQVQYRVLVQIFNRPSLLWPFTRLVRLAKGTLARLRRP